MTIELFRDKASEWDMLASEYEEVEREIRRLTDRKEKLKKSLIDRVEGDCMMGGGIKVSRHFRKGAIDYGKFLEDREIKLSELEIYRKPEIETWRIDFY